jgi:hypothetical protein
VVPRTPVQVSSAIERLHQESARSGVHPSDEEVAHSARNAPARHRKGKELRLSGNLAIAFGVLLSVLATVGLALATVFACLYWAVSERIVDVREGAEAQRLLNQSCQSELAITKGELNRMDRLLSYARSGSR